MEFSIFVAKIVALIYLPLAIALLTGQVNGKDIVDSFEKSPALQLIIGYSGVIVGVTLVTYHNVWVQDWPVLITILGWIAIIESVTFLAFPKFSFSLTKWIPMNGKLWGAIALILGLIFAYFGFFA